MLQIYVGEKKNMENAFKKNPSKESLKNDLELVQSIIANQSRDNTVTVENGVVTVTYKNDGRKKIFI